MGFFCFKLVVQTGHLFISNYLQVLLIYYNFDHLFMTKICFLSLFSFLSFFFYITELFLFVTQRIKCDSVVFELNLATSTPENRKLHIPK